jgi:methenyltetrahydromethanopterin cyclohydrolase
MNDLGMNERAWRMADGYADRAGELRLNVHALPGGARVLDAGVEARGGFGAGLMLAELCMGGLGHVSYAALEIGGHAWPGVHVWTDHPATACMASQYAGWAITPEGYFAMGSGPLRAKARVEKELFGHIDYGEDPSRGVLVLEGASLPNDAVAEWVAGKAGVATNGITFAIAPTASLAGGVQIAARVLETGLHKMETVGFDVRRVVSGIGNAPVPPVAKDDMKAIGRTNDCVLYGGQARYTVDAGDDELSELAAKLPASASEDYGAPFIEIFKRYDNDFYKIDPLLFSPGEVWLTSIATGKTFHAGGLDSAVLARSLHGEYGD